MKQPLHQGAEKSGKTLPELLFAIVERKAVRIVVCHRGAQGREYEPHRRQSFSPLLCILCLF